MSRLRFSHRVLAWGGGLILVAALGLLASRWLAPLPPLTPALKLVALGRYEEAEPLLKAYLASDSGSPEARQALAETLLNHPGEDREARAKQALAELEAVPALSPRQFATVSTLRGRAFQTLHRLGSAESAYNAALRTDPSVGEAGWLLLQLYYIERRTEDARRLALRLFRIEPDQRDRVRLLIEICRSEVQPLADAGLITELEPAYRAEPDNVPSSVAYLLALAGEGQEVDRAVTGLEALVARHPQDVSAWDALLTALSRTGQQEAAQNVLHRVPAARADDPRIVRHRGEIALDQGRYAEAIAMLRVVVATRPGDVKALHRLQEALKFDGQAAESEAIQLREADHNAAGKLLRGENRPGGSDHDPGLFEAAMARPNLGVLPDPALYRQFASIREHMGHRDEALAWYRLTLESDPGDAESRAAIARLEPRSPGKP